jgi:aminopeptidase YwaD
MKSISLIRFIILIAFAFVSFLQVSFSQISTDSLRNHVYFLAADSMEGRRSGGRTMEKVQKYIGEHFKQAGLKPIGKDFFQEFPAFPGFGKNIIGLIEGSDPILKNEYIVLGAHYDHIGWMVKNDSIIVFNGADDNASGTASIMEVARILYQKKAQLKRSVLIIAFDAEEEGLWGSSYYLKHPIVEEKNIKAMMSIDMVGWYKKSQKITFDGCGSFDGGKDFMESITKVKDLNVEISSSSILWKDRTDTRPFYDSIIPCMYVSTGLESPYHKPEDDADLIDYEGMTKIGEQLCNMTIGLASKEKIDFTPTREILRVFKSHFKLGVNLSYNTNYQNYSKGPFITKPLIGFGAGLISQIHLFSYFDLQTQVNYEYLGSRSFAGDIRLHNINIPVSVMFTTHPDIVRVYVKLGGYYSYSFDGKLYTDKIDWVKTGFNRNDIGLVVGFGMEIFNLQLDFQSSMGFPGFYSTEPLNFMDIGKATNVTTKLTVSYFFIN